MKKIAFRLMASGFVALACVGASMSVLALINPDRDRIGTESVGASKSVAGAVTARAQTTTYKSIPLDCGGWWSGFAVHSSGRLYGYGDVFGVWRSDDAGQSWKSLQTDFTNNYPQGNYAEHTINGMDVAKGNADKVAFITESRLWISTDGGSSWTESLSGLKTPRERGSTGVFFHPSDDNHIWLAATRTGMSGGLWRSTDGGANWNKVGGSTFDGVVPVTIYTRSEFPDQIWVGTQSGLYVSTNRGENWQQAWSGGTVRAIARRADGIGYIATNKANGGGFRVAASDWNSPSTYTLSKTVSWWDGWAPNNATVLANGNFITGGDGDRDPDNSAQLNDAQRVSTDGGQSWTYLPMTLKSSPQPVWFPPILAGAKPDGGRDMIVQDPTKHSRLWMTGGAAPVVSNDGGQNWSFLPNGGGLAGVMTYKVRFVPGNPKHALVPGADMGAFVINDGGAGGVAFCSRASDNTMITLHEVMSSREGETLVGAGVNQGANITHITRSTNGGKTWSALNLAKSGLPPSHDGITRAVMSLTDARDFLVLLANSGSPSNPGMWRTTDGGVSFSQVNGLPAGMDTGGRNHQENAYLETDGVNTDTRYLALRPQFFRSNDGGANWSQLTGVFGTDWVHGFAVDHARAGKLWAVGGWRGVKTSDNGGDSWSDVAGFTDAYRVDAASGRVAVWGKRAGDEWFKIYYSPDNGLNWTEKSGPNARFPFLRDLAVDPTRPGQIWVSGISVNVIDGPK